MLTYLLLAARRSVFGSDTGKTVIAVKALHGLKSSRASFSTMLANMGIRLQIYIGKLLFCYELDIYNMVLI